jgi:sugar/nucleoside kinase (ribokinase family)
MSPIVGIRGGLSIDHLVVARSGGRFDQLGGPGLYAALGARLVEGTEVRLCTDLPDDDGRFNELFTRLLIDTTACARAATVPRVWILNSSEGRRIVSTSPQSDVELETESEATAEPEPEHAPRNFYEGLAGLLESSPKHPAPIAAGTITGIDPHQLQVRSGGLEYLRKVSPQGSVILPSRVQLSLINDDPRAAARKVLEALALPVIARLDSEGMYVLTHSGCWNVQDHDVHVRETTGAGDSSAAAIVAALARGADLVTAAQIGVSVARIAVADWGHASLSEADRLTTPFNRITATKELVA